MREIAVTNLRRLNEVEFWERKRWTTTRQDIMYISEMKTRLAVENLENLPPGRFQRGHPDVVGTQNR